MILSVRDRSFVIGFMVGSLAAAVTAALIANLYVQGDGSMSLDRIRLQCARFESEYQVAVDTWNRTYKAPPIDIVLEPVVKKYGVIFDTPDPKAFCESLSR
jgi:hypothetical protein